MTAAARKDGFEALSSDMAQMGGLAESQLSAAIESIARRDVALAELTIREDERIDAWQRRIESQAIALAGGGVVEDQDLRAMLASIRIAVDLERIGDLAKNIAKRTLSVSEEEPLRVTQSLVRMGRIALAQLKNALDAYGDRDAEKARSVWGGDDEIDELYNSLFRELLTYMMEDPRTIGFCAHLLFVAKNFERVGDHATNIAETVCYVITGEYLSNVRPKGDVTSLLKPNETK